ncbi:MAG: hypothetical protein K2K15_04960, partial [Anaeroplasmataceae bacterium]|nr:hypothetical protein [Anaeroplasmataceae bacterium]
MKKILAIISLTFILLLAGCFFDDDDTDKPEPNTPIEVALDSISLVNSKGEEVTEVTEYQSTLAYKHSNVYVKAKYVDETVKDVTTQATFSEVDLNTLGKVSVEVSYKEKTTSYTLNIIENKETNISINTTHAKVIYHIGDVFSSDGLVVRVKRLNGLVETVSNYDIAIRNSKNVSMDKTQPFENTGEYKVTVTVGSASNDYSIAVATEQYEFMSIWDASTYANDMTFDANGTAHLTGRTKLLETDTISFTAETSNLKNKNKDDNLINPSYDNKNFSKALEVTTNKDIQLILKEDTELLFYLGGQNGRGLVFRTAEDEIYAIGNINGYTSYQYVALKAGTYDITTNVDTLLLYAIIFGNGKSTAPKPVQPVVPTTGLVAELGTTVYQGTDTLDLSSLSVYKVEGTNKTPVSNYTTKLYLDDEEVTAFTETGFYTLEVTANNQTALCSVVYFEEKITDDLEALDPETIETNVYANVVEFSLEKFIEATPLGYTFSGVLVKDKDGNVVQDIPYNGVMTNIAIGDLEKNTEYVIQPYYDLALQATYSLQARAEVTPGYRIYFVGIHVITYGDVMYRVKLTYQGELLYTYILAEGGNLYVWNFNFMLPIKYEDYRCVGTEVGDAFNVTKDMEVEVILVKKGEETEFTVVFYGWNDGEILKIEKVAKGGDATPPSMDNIDQFRTIDGKLYRFDGWTDYHYQNINSTTIVYARKTYIPKLVVPEKQYNIHVTDTTMRLELGFVYGTTYSLNYDETKYLLIEPNGNQSEIQYNSTLENFMPDSTYTVRFHIVYNLGSGDEVLEEDIEVKTLATGADLGITTDISDITYRGVTLTTPDYELIEGYYYYNEEMKMDRYNLGTKSHSVRPDYLVQNKEYNFYYYTINEGGIWNKAIYHYYSVPVTVTTLDASEPDIPTELYVIDISEKGTFASFAFFYHWTPGDVDILLQSWSFIPELEEIEPGHQPWWQASGCGVGGSYEPSLGVYTGTDYVHEANQWIPDDSKPNGGYYVEY